jgi:hypothetical protein
VKALTIYQPWASLIMIGAKPFEFRGWDYAARYPQLLNQRIVIHASARPIKPAEIHDLLQRLDDGTTGLKADLARPLLERLMAAAKCQGVLELGAGLGTAVIGKARRVGDIFKGQIADSDRLDHSLFGWPLTEHEPFDHPSPMRGAQGFWNWPEGL